MFTGFIYVTNCLNVPNTLENEAECSTKLQTCLWLYLGTSDTYRVFLALSRNSSALLGCSLQRLSGLCSGAAWPGCTKNPLNLRMIACSRPGAFRRDLRHLKLKGGSGAAGRFYKGDTFACCPVCMQAESLMVIGNLSP